MCEIPNNHFDIYLLTFYKQTEREREREKEREAEREGERGRERQRETQREGLSKRTIFRGIIQSNYHREQLPWGQSSKGQFSLIPYK